MIRLVDFTSPETLLAMFLIPGDAIPRRLFITGPSGCGKTTLCLRLAAAASRAGYSLAGYISPPIFENGRKTGFALQALPGREQRRLGFARILPQPTLPASAPVTQDWRFDPSVFAWGRRILQETPPADLLLVDELGPLEFDLQAGMTTVLERIDLACDRLACVVVRPEYLPRALERWEEAAVLDASIVQIDRTEEGAA